MYQEIITYMIIGAAVTLVVLKTIKKFGRKKTQKVDYKKAKLSTEHNCSECAAECMMRDAPKRIIEASHTKCSPESSSLQ